MFKVTIIKILSITHGDHENSGVKTVMTLKSNVQMRIVASLMHMTLQRY
jgi:hypothetical protein